MGNVGSSFWYAAVKIGYCAGTMLRASVKEIGTTMMVPLRVPVALLGYCAAIGFGEDCDLHKGGGKEMELACGCGAAVQKPNARAAAQKEIYIMAVR